MCGIIAIVRRPATRLAPTADEVLSLLAPLEAGMIGRDTESPEGLDQTAEILETVDALLRGVPGVTALVRVPGLRARIASVLGPVKADIGNLEIKLDSGAADAAPDEKANAQLLRLKDAHWAVSQDRLRTAEAVAALAGPQASDSAIAAFTSVQEALSSLDRLEVRGRDSAGLHLFVYGPSVVNNPLIADAVASRSTDGLFRSGSVRLTEQGLGFVYKAAAEIGELGDNSAVLRAAIRSDALLHSVLREDDVQVSILGHTRWASVGIISEANAHPLNSELEDGDSAGPYAIGVLNGDVDNHADLCADEDMCFANAITTDAKVIPALLSTHVAEGDEVGEAFRRSVASFEGSVAVAAQSETAPHQLLLALRGSGQALYVGLAEDAYVVASEPYGLVEMTSRYLRLDGETPSNLDNANSSRGQIVTVEGSLAGEIAGLQRVSYDGTALPLLLDEVVEAEITTRDIDRAGYPHFLLKEITESPKSFRKTLRGKLLEEDGELRVSLPDETLPESVRADLRSGRIDEVIAIAQGTAAIAASSFARALEDQIARAGLGLRVRTMVATELSGFGMDRSFDNALIVAVSQSGTTTDTNRTVDVVRRKGARVIAIVNRRGSDLTDKSDGVLYTSDGRDVEMSVASTKAFYSQVAAGFLLATAISVETGADASSPVEQRILRGLTELPLAMEQLLERRQRIGEIAARLAPERRYWAITGNGPNLIAAEEIRIKLSELCYKSMACDATEDKKHIDLSSEPLILVCAAGLTGSNADDVAKEVAIFRAHKAAPIVIANEGDARYANALDVVAVPVVEPALGFVLSTMAGHIFGYEAAKAIDALARPIREVRAAVESAVEDDPDRSAVDVLKFIRPSIEAGADQFFRDLRASQHNGHVEASSATRLAMLLRYGMGVIPLNTYQLEFGKVGTPAVLIEDLVAASTTVIDELTRPIDAIKHQAKTVTVGISRTDETLLEVALVRSVLDAGAARDSLSFENLQTLSALDAAVEEVTGYTRYRVEDPHSDDARAYVVDRGGLSLGISSRVERDPVLKGTKHRAATGGKVGVAKGRADGRTVILVPELKDGESTGLTLMHVRFHDRIDPAVARSVLMGFGNSFSKLRDAVLETEEVFNEDLLGQLPVEVLLCTTVSNLADYWTSQKDS